MEKQSSKSLLWIVVIVIVVLAGVLIALLVTHNNSNKLSSSEISTDKQQIQMNWTAFFAGSTSLQNREDLLQNGSQFAQPIQSEFSSLGSESPSAKIVSINLSNSTSAKIVYTVYLSGQPVLTNQDGQALYLNNTWKVSDSTLCGLLGMAGDKPAVCKTS